MATALWLRTIRHQRMDRQHVEPCTRDDPRQALEEGGRKGGITRPDWLEKPAGAGSENRQTRFLPDDFLEAVDFQRMEIEFIDPDAKKKKSADYRNAF